MKNDLISVIVPIYNVGKYLRKCIDSIISQTYENLEIILVDDGSTDESGVICDEYKEKDERIKVVHKENGGLTSARKVGALASKGDNVTFVDGDDWIAPQMYEALFAAMKNANAQMVISGIYRDNENGTYAEWAASDWPAGIYKDDKAEELKSQVFRNGKTTINGSSCNKLFERTVLLSGLLAIDDIVHGIEDDMFVYISLLKSQTIVILDQSFYHAYERKESATHVKHKNYYLQLHYAISAYEKLMAIENDADFRRQCEMVLVGKILEGTSHVLETVRIPLYYWNDCFIGAEEKKVAIYGGGDVGECYYTQIGLKHKIVAWVDKASKKSKESRHELQLPSKLMEEDYDYVFIAILRENIAMDIKADLMSMGIPEEKIIWEKPLTIVEYLGLADS